MAFRKIRYYNNDINAVRQEFRKYILEKKYIIIDHNPQQQKIVFRRNKTLLQWKSYELTAMFTAQKNKVKAIITGSGPNDVPAAHAIANEFMQEMDKRLPVILPTDH